MPDDALSVPEQEHLLKKVPEWELGKKAILRTFEFDSFQDAIDFVNDVAEIAEELNHHPDINIRYDRVALTLTTHAAGGVTKADFQLAGKIDNLVD
ncbi:MAG: 4a-hydroxytetrahydrobiopterin dehydratase [Verrucomicrobiales bacterium]